ncbi:MAG: DegV family protein [Clostridiales bacterium]|nr:DegV family protein [Clostridiales bacterium]
MSQINISADSTCDLSPELKGRYGITTLPLYVNFEGKSCRDGVDAQPDDLYESYYRTGKVSTTSAPTPEDYIEYFRGLTDGGNEVIHFNISSEMSSAHQNAVLASQEVPGVHVVDSRNLSTGTALLALEAYDLAQAGKPAAEIAKLMETERDKVYASFVIDTLEFLWKGGRCSGVAALGANLLRLKPCIEVTDGKMHVGRKFRGRMGDVLEQYAAARLSGRDGLRLNRVFITHSGVEDGMVERVKGIVKSLAPFEEILVTRAGCTISSHCGPGTLGVLFMAD